MKNFKLFLFIIFSSICFNLASEDFEYEVIADELNNPWAIAMIDDNNILFTELSGQLRRIKDGVLAQESVSGVPEVLFAGQGGLSGIILDPNFKDNNRLYIAFSSPDEGKSTNTLEVISAILDQNSLTNVNTIFKASPSRRTAAHYGARMAFLDDGTLLITSGDGFNYREDAQNLDNHFGKVIRLNTDGSIPSDNPFTNQEGALPEIYSFGHRNPQGIVFANGLIYENEHGPMGGDELNIVEAAKNYGWPAITYGKDYSGAMISPFTEKDGMEQPIKYWVPSIAPSGMAFYDKDLFSSWKGNILISALVPGDVRRLVIKNSEVIEEEIHFSDLGRIRDIVTSPNGTLVLATDGPNGKLIRVQPKK